MKKWKEKESRRTRRGERRKKKRRRRRRRKKKKKKKKEEEEEHVYRERAISMIQRIYRGHIGRKHATWKEEILSSKEGYTAAFQDVVTSSNVDPEKLP